MDLKSPIENKFLKILLFTNKISEHLRNSMKISISQNDQSVKQLF